MGHPDWKQVVFQVLQQKRESDYAEAHKHLRTAKGHKPHTLYTSSSEVPEDELYKTPGFDHPAATGVIYVMDRAAAKGWTYGDKEWGNFGQGAPEVGPIPDCPPRPHTITMTDDEFEYASVAGTKGLREAVANLYNARYRGGKASKYTWENVCIVPGGRAGLTRTAACIGDANVGFFLPEY
ncbi:hypothetical protein HDU98_002721, partial [Podochytrium sp. JEL0797]